MKIAGGAGHQGRQTAAPILLPLPLDRCNDAVEPLDEARAAHQNIGL
ncbi:hypothetical protein GA0061105_101110 [Rhizobium aethiopicum]|uniref:Uncharacterized protein n=1 Tax=Rhizobium aethiopicum TaxID=1138170 RepID=A0A1C3XVK1_9HYPH|nr:hypothetical protein GA0061105_101110 [Rhizobium aethiopicum]